MSNDTLMLELPKEAVTVDDKVAVLPFWQVDIGSHQHHFFELAYVTGGCALHTLNGNTAMIREGDYFIMDYDSVHSYAQTADFTLINCMFLPEVVDYTLRGCRTFDELMRVCLTRYYKQYSGQAVVNRVFRDDDGRVLQLLTGAKLEYLNKYVGYTEIFRGRLMEILILTMRRVLCQEGIQRPVLPQSTIVLEVVRYLDTHFQEKALLGDFCQEYHYSLQYVSRKFKQETGFTASEYLQKKRLEKSCELLICSDMSIQEIAHQIGYEDTRFFNQLFQKKLKMSPREYRKMSVNTERI